MSRAQIHSLRAWGPLRHLQYKLKKPQKSRQKLLIMSISNVQGGLNIKIFNNLVDNEFDVSYIQSKMSTSAPSSPESTALQNLSPELPFRKSTVDDKPVVRRPKNATHEFSDKLTRQQWAFIEHYMAGKKPYNAAKLAGYAESTCLVAYDALLNNPDIQEEIQKRVDKYYKEIGITEKRVLQDALRFLESNLFDYGVVEPDGSFKVDLRNVPRELGYAIQEYSVDSQGRPRIKLVDKLGALNTLGKFRGMGTEKVQITGKDGAPLTIQALDSIVAQHVTINQIQNQQVNQLSPSSQSQKVLSETTVEAAAV